MDIFISFVTLSMLGLSVLSSTALISANLASMGQAIICVIGGIVYCSSREILIKKKAIVFIAFVCLLIGITLRFNYSSLLMIPILYYILRDCDDLSIPIKRFVYFLFISFTLILFFYFIMGFNVHLDKTTWRINDIIDRNSLGFTHPNQASIFFLVLTIGFVYLLATREKGNYYRLFLVLWFVLSRVIYSYTMSRTTFYTVYVLLGILFVMGKKSINKPVSKIIRYFTISMPLIFVLLSVMLVVMPNNAIIDKILTGRLTLFQSFYHQVGFTMFGSIEMESAMLDNSYLNMILSKGISFLFLWLVLWMNLLSSKKKYTRLEVLILGTYFACAITETILFKFELTTLIMMIIMNSSQPKVTSQSSLYQPLDNVGVS